jgi:ATP/maltotriose-dependent transcriptional regulator MalT
MFLLPPRLRQLLRKKQERRYPRVYSKDEQLVLEVREMAVTQRRGEQEVYDELIESGMNVLRDKDKYADVWNSLSHREQQVTALTCLGYRSHEIAGMLGISYETIRTHSKHVYAKFDLNRKELRLTLKRWNFEEWWEDHQV